MAHSIPMTHVSDSALKVFINEVPGHVAFFEHLLSSIDPLNGDEQRKVLADEARAIEARCHLIRGGAAFLGLDNIKEKAETAEKLFDKKLLTSTKVSELTRVLKAVVDSLLSFEG